MVEKIQKRVFEKIPKKVFISKRRGQKVIDKRNQKKHKGVKCKGIL